MTHEELLAMIEEKIDNVESISGIKATPWHSLLAVVELHKPFDFTMGGEPYLGCNCGQEYPCPTIQVIQEQLK